MSATLTGRPGISWTALREREELRRRWRTRAAAVAVVATGFTAALTAAQVLGTSLAR
ncbi:MAG: hypothetical protein ACT4QF_17810 [Sporichthyaceae bacterium]